MKHFWLCACAFFLYLTNNNGENINNEYVAPETYVFKHLQNSITQLSQKLKRKREHNKPSRFLQVAQLLSLEGQPKSLSALQQYLPVYAEGY